MSPTVVCKSGSEPLLEAITSCLSRIDCSEFFPKHIGMAQREQRSVVTCFQNRLKSELERSMPDVIWSTEHCPGGESRDCVDVFGQGHDFVVAIELDKTRADQVAKKFVSRMAILPSTTVYFISLCYPGTESMNRVECSKYFRYCATLASRMSNHYAGLVVK
jgi:hypothetical protein